MAAVQNPDTPKIRGGKLAYLVKKIPGESSARVFDVLTEEIWKTEASQVYQARENKKDLSSKLIQRAKDDLRSGRLLIGGAGSLAHVMNWTQVQKDIERLTA